MDAYNFDDLKSAGLIYSWGDDDSENKSQIS